MSVLGLFFCCLPREAYAQGGDPTELSLSAPPSTSATVQATADSIARNILYFEPVGNLGVSFNYERMVVHSTRAGFSLRLGGGGIPGYFVGGLVMGNFLMKFEEHCLELGAGTLFIKALTRYGDFTDLHVPLTATLGYRYQPEDSGTMFKIGAIFLYSGTDIGANIDDGLSFGIGVGIGFTF